MRTSKYLHVFAVAVGVGLGGCDEGDVYEPEENVVDNTEVSDAITFRFIGDNGLELNGAKFNGAKFNGAKFNGAKFNGAKFNGAKFNGTAFGGSVSNMGLGGWELEPGTSKLRALGTNSTIYAGNALVDSEQDWEVDDELGNPIVGRLKIRGVVQSSTQSDLFFTDLVYKVGTNEWESFCKDAYDNAVEAIAIPGYFDAATASWHDEGDGNVAWACRGTAAGKCVEWGYRMWAEVGGTSLADYYRACTRMVRADYCGNNVTHTVNGNPIDVSDAKAIQVSETAWPVEAKWGPNGAVCLNTPRRQAWSRSVVIAECQAAGRGTLPTCDTTNASEHGGLLMTRANAL